MCTNNKYIYIYNIYIYDSGQNLTGIYTVYDRIIGEFPAKITVCMYTVHLGSGQPCIRGCGCKCAVWRAFSRGGPNIYAEAGKQPVGLFQKRLAVLYQL